MSQASYFDDPEKASALREEALSWIGTPFREYYQEEIEEQKILRPDITVNLKGIGGGIDCIGLVQEILSRIRATPKFVFKRIAGDYQSHQTGDKVLDWFRGKLDDPQSKVLAEIFVDLEIPDAVKDPYALTPRDFFKAGDICVLRNWALFHLPIIFDNDLHFVNALPRAGVVEGTIQDSSYSKHLVAVFRLRPKGG